MSDDPLVWVGHDRYHTHEECRALRRAKNPVQKRLSLAEQQTDGKCQLARCERTDP